MHFIREIKHSDLTESTNDDAKTGHQAGDAFGTVYVAHAQTKGRGSHGRIWTSEPGNLYCTILLENIFPPFLPLGVGLAVHRTLSKLLPEKTLHIKWPNDVLLEDKKVCGILCESSVTPGAASHPLYVGVGINVAQTLFPDEIRDTATSLALHGSLLPSSHILERLLLELDLMFNQILASPASIIDACNQHLAYRGNRMRLDEHEGIVEGIDRNGALLFSAKAYVSGTLRHMPTVS